ncbi:uncharacterized protein RSE6_00917 [Rhynchosporium secalis]|uniref:Uncharacterized protein n=1 Tax=Rhynchosporium secalis TaxID=38038 RepID=A0A1E1LWH3_RHYSE|nr:uncharacterized protein RSE6_00917 [Rhynchosporium secalis]
MSKILGKCGEIQRAENGSGVTANNAEQVRAEEHKTRGSDGYYYELADTRRLQGRLAEREHILQDLLRHQEAFLDSNRRVDIMSRLRDIAQDKGRKREAASWCKDLGFCYSRQGLFDEAISHFEMAISKIERLRKENDDSLDLSTESIKVREKATRPYVVHLQTSILHWQQANAVITSVQEGGTHNPDACMHMLEAWIEWAEHEKTISVEIILKSNAPEVDVEEMDVDG